MKHFYRGIITVISFLVFGISSVSGQTATAIIDYTGFQACGGCAVCGDDYWCTNTPGSYCGDTPPCISKTFFDPVPAGHVVTSVTVDYYTGSCEGAAFVSSINGFSLPMAYDGNTGCLCSDNPCMVTTSVSSVYPCGMPGYNYGGNNTFYLCSYAPMCINKAILTFTYVDPDIITPSITASGPLSFCEGGSVTLDAGTGYSDYDWNTGATSQIITATTSGTYSVTVTSTTGCTTGSSSVVVTALPHVTPTFTQLGPYCQGETPGALPTNSQDGITGTWFPSSISTATNGSTIYTFTPNAGQCAYETTMTVLVEPSVTPNFTQLGPYCVGESPDPLPTTSTNGVTGTWSPATINTSTAGTITYNFTPAGACAAPVSMDITVNPNPTANALVHGTPSCNGMSDGSIILGVTGGTPDYSFNWSNGYNTQDLMDIPAGTYSVVVTDANGCTATSSAVVSEPDPVTGNVISITDAICNSYGAATVEGIGGTPPFTYVWPSNAGGVSGGTATQLNAGNYEVTIFDNYDCEGTIEFTVPQTGGINASVTNTNDVSCAGGSDGQITVNITGGNPDYEINWGNGSATSASNTYTITGLNANSYNIYITDGNGCDYTITNVNIGQPSPIIANPINIVNVDCYGQASGSAEIQVSGGTPDYSIVWPIPGITGNIANNLQAGTYIVTVTDANNCSIETTVNINQADSLVVNEIITNAACYNENGQAIINVESGGNPPYSILWQDGHDQFQHNAIPPETNFSYLITDFNGCTHSGSVYIEQPDELIINIDGTNLNCYNDNSGTAVVSVTGGTMPYFYEWSNSIENPGISNLPAGTYCVTVTDFNACSVEDCITINQPEQIILDISTANVDCGNELGNANLNITGGVPDYHTIWSTGDTTLFTNELMAGTHYVTVTDSHNCSVSNEFNIENTNNIHAQIVVMQNILCPNETSGALTAQSSNGIEPYSYYWSNSITAPSISNLGPGTYLLTLTDSWGCSGTAEHTLIAPDVFNINEVIQDIVCFGGNEGSISVNVTGGTPPYDLDWSNGDSGPIITELVAGAYNLTVTDFNNCVYNQTFVLNAPEDDLKISANVNNISCYGESDGEIHMDASGGTRPYEFKCFLDSYQFSGQYATGLIAGNYRIKVTDYNGCTNESTVIVSEPAPLEASYVITHPSCIGNNDGYFEITVTGGTAPYFFDLQGEIFDLPYFSDLMQGDYFVTIIDNNQCELEFGPVMLIDVDELCLKIPNAITPNSDGINDTWIIEGLEKYPSNIVRVFNRWGQLLYYGEHGAEPWDGTTLEGNMVPTGNYLYVIDLFDGELEFTGSITVVY